MLERDNSLWDESDSCFVTSLPHSAPSRILSANWTGAITETKRFGELAKPRPSDRIRGKRNRLREGAGATNGLRAVGHETNNNMLNEVP